MSRSKSSHRWLQEHFNDEFVQRSKQQGYRSRAVYKLEELDQKDALIRKGMTIVDLGAAPGGWTQYAIEKIQEQGQVFALDILPMDPLAGVEIIQGDFREQDVLDELLNKMNNSVAELVMSDMAPNITGVDAVDQPKSMYLAELALELAIQVLNKNGNFVVKVFQGRDFDAYLKAVREHFAQVKIRKPSASRDRSKEVYIVGKGFKK